jgi:twitching motility protein PilT
MELCEAFDRFIETGGSDLLLSAGAPIRLRLDGELRDLDGDDRPLTPADVERMLGDILDERQRHELADRRHLDFALTWQDRFRLRGNAYYQRGSLAAAFRLLPLEIPGFEQLGIPASVVGMASLRQGLILVTGSTGSGKSTTQAALIDHLNRTRACHIITIEDPIEYVHRHRRAIVDQREVGSDARSFADALRVVYREDPDVVLIGEMRDLETVAAALTIAETGHLVLATLHTNDAAQAIDRILDVFPAPHHLQVRVQLAACLTGVVYQQLLPAIGGGRLAAFEVLVANHAVRTLIKEGKTNQIRNVIQTGGQEGSQTFERALTRLVRDGLVGPSVAHVHSRHPQEIGA